MKNPTKRAMDKLHKPKKHQDQSKYSRDVDKEILDELVAESEEMGMYENAKVVVYSPVVGYMTAYVPLAVLESTGKIILMDDIGRRADLESPSNLELAERIMEL